MAKRAAKAKGSAPAWMKLRLDGQKVCIAGWFEKYDRLFTRKHLESYVTDEGGTVTDTLDASCHFLLMKEPTGSSGHEKKVAQLNSKGASISVISQQQLYDMIVPQQSEVEEMLRGDTIAHQCLARRLATARMKPDCLNRAPAPFYINGLALKGQSVESIPLWCISQDQADLREIKALESLQFRSQYRFGALTNSRLDGARLLASFASLTDCSCRDVDFSCGSLGGFGQNARCRADFTKSNLTRFHFMNTDCSDSTFTKANLTGASFSGCKVQNANFLGAILKSIEGTEAEFTGSDFTNADLSEADLIDAKFENCNLSGANLRGALMTGASLKNANLAGADFTDVNVAMVNFEGADTSKVKGLSKEPTRVLQAGPKLTELSNLAINSKGFDTNIRVATAKESVQLAVRQCENGYCASWSNDIWAETLRDWASIEKTVAVAFVAAASAWPEAIPDVSSITASAKGMKINKKKLSQLVREAWCETFQISLPEESELKNQRMNIDAEKQAKRIALLAKLDKSNGVEDWNKASTIRWEVLNPFRGFDLSEKTLDSVNLKRVQLEECSFTNSSLVGADLAYSSYKGSNFRNSKLMHLKSNCTHFEECDFTGADLSEASLRFGYLAGAKLCDANLTYADLCEADLRGAIFTGSELTPLDKGKGDAWRGALFDETTVFPSGFKIPESLIWKGTDIDPRATKALKLAKSKGSIDLKQFMVLLEASVNKDRLKKATTMLKAERFQMFAQAADDHLAGVVKNQNDRDLVYSCRLTKDGDFSCCTQNLKVCGGMRGALCKHLLVLIIGMTNGGELDPTTVNLWIQASRYKKPKLDKDAMGETLLCYKGAEAGNIDWRPMETIPEDYYSL